MNTNQTEVCHQVIGGSEVQNMKFVKNVSPINRSMF